MKKWLYVVFFSLIIMKLNAAEPYVIMWDLGGTLVDVRKFSFARELGLMDLAFYYFSESGRDKTHIQKRIFQTLETLGGMQEGPEHHKVAHDNCVLPQHMANWLAGKFDKNRQEFITDLQKGVDKLNQEGYFISRREYRIIRRAMRAMFDPKILVRYQKIMKPMVKLLEKIQTAGKDRCMILSNWDAASFALFLDTPIGQELSCYVKPEDMIISGYIYKNKPHPDFFIHALETHGLNPERCILIDNDKANCKTAQKLGMRAIHFTGDARQVLKEFKKLSIL